MKPTIDYLQTAFDKYNRLCFAGQLSQPTFTLSRAKTRLGWMKHQVRRQHGVAPQHHFTIALTTAYDLSPDMLDDVLIHEMIHLYIASHQLKDTSPHGRVFQQLMQAINARHHRHIRVAFRPTDLPPSATPSASSASLTRGQRIAKRTGPYIVMAIETTDHHYYLSSVAQCAVATVARMARSQHQILHVEWLLSEDHRFARYPRVRTLRAVRVSKADYDSIKATAQPLHQCIGK